MSSFTSSSETAATETATATGVILTPAAVNRRIVAVLVLGMVLVVIFFRLFTMANNVSGETILGRVLEARAALPRILQEDKDLVMAFGSSMTEAGFSARRFDRGLAQRGVEVKSFNFGFGGLNPYFQDYLSRRIREQLEAEDRRLKLVLIEFVPFQATRARWNGALPMVDSYVPLLASSDEMLRMAVEDPQSGVLRLTIHHLRDGISAEMVTHFFGRPLRAREPKSELPEDEAAMERLDEVGQKLQEAFKVDYPDYKESEWSYEWQGAGTIPEERSAETLEIFKEYYQLKRQERLLDNDKLDRIACCDIEELHFEELLVESFIRIVKNFQAVSDHVEVVLFPRNTDWIHYSDESAARLKAVLERIRDETGVPIRDYQLLPTVTPDMYSDTTHLARYSGDVTFTDQLIDDFAPLLGAP